MARYDRSELFIAACVSAERMPSALEQLSHSVGAEGATLVRSRGDVALDFIASAAIVDDVASYAGGDRPPDPRTHRVLPQLSEGFRLDADDFTADEIRHDPFYQEFLRPRGLGWHACALLAGGVDSIHLSFKRKLKRGPFETRDLAVLAAQLPLLRVAVEFSRRLSGEGLAPARLITTQARGLYGIDADRKVSVLQAGAETGCVFTIRQGRLVAAERRSQAKLDAVLDSAYRRKAQSALLMDEAGRRWAFRVEVVPSDAGTGPFVALGVLACIDMVGAPGPATTKALSELFALSAAEARIAVWIAQGLSIDEVAAQLMIRPGTVRNHLKSVFRKLGVARQSELSALLLRL